MGPLSALPYRLTVDATPVAWAAHKGFGRRAYNPRHADRLEVQWQLKKQWKQPPLDRMVSLVFLFSIPIPKSVSKKKRAELLQRIWHDQKPDATNLQKFLEDALKGIVIEDDKKVVRIESQKRWTKEEKGHTFIQITIEE